MEGRAPPAPDPGHALSREHGAIPGVGRAGAREHGRVRPGMLRYLHSHLPQERVGGGGGGGGGKGIPDMPRIFKNYLGVLK